MQFDVYENLDKDTNQTYPYFIDIQTNLLDSLNSRVVIPLTPANSKSEKYPQNLCPIIQFEGNGYALLSHQITSVPLSILKKKVQSAEIFRNEVVNAIDFLVTGI
jgi:toxin CcdB